MTDFFLTSIVTLLLGMLYIALIVRVILQRRTGRVAFGDGEDPRLRGAIRAQVNAGEQIPLFLITFALCEWHGLSDLWLGLVGLTFIVGRLFNAYGMGFVVHRFRVYGTALNLTALILALVSLLMTLF